MREVVLAVVAFVVMEPVTAATHRFVMHGPGLLLHRSHHRRTYRAGSFARSKTRSAHTGWERNDAYPVMFAAVVCVGFWLGFNGPQLAELVPIGVGVTAYGAAYGLVHDVYIHRRLRWFGDRLVPIFERLAAAHELHHRFNGAPYGMLVPIVPRRLRAAQPSG